MKFPIVKNKFVDVSNGENYFPNVQIQKNENWSEKSEKFRYHIERESDCLGIICRCGLFDSFFHRKSKTTKLFCT